MATTKVDLVPEFDELDIQREQQVLLITPIILLFCERCSKRPSLSRTQLCVERKHANVPACIIYFTCKLLNSTQHFLSVVDCSGFDISPHKPRGLKSGEREGQETGASRGRPLQRPG
jgi:hypothetical protein